MRAVLPLNAKMIEGTRQTNLFCATNSKSGPVPSALIKLIKLISITLLPQDELKLSQVDEVKHNHVLEQLSRPPEVQAIWPNICPGHWVRESRSNSRWKQRFGDLKSMMHVTPCERWMTQIAACPQGRCLSLCFSTCQLSESHAY